MNNGMTTDEVNAVINFINSSYTLFKHTNPINGIELKVLNYTSKRLLSKTATKLRK